MKTLTEKDLKYYLGTGLKTTDGELIGLTDWIGWCGVFMDKTGERHIPISAIKPLMLPLSALTEPLPDSSVPIVELAKMCYSKLNLDVIMDDGKCYVGSKFNEKQYTFWYSIYENSFYCISTYRSEPKAVPYQTTLFEYLYQHHFWLGDQSYFDYGLIIDKRTVK